MEGLLTIAVRPPVLDDGLGPLGVERLGEEVLGAANALGMSSTNASICSKTVSVSLL